MRRGAGARRLVCSLRIGPRRGFRQGAPSLGVTPALSSTALSVSLSALCRSTVARQAASAVRKRPARDSQAATESL
jgi:hypothetical protein